MSDFVAGDVFVVAHPFIRSTYLTGDDVGPYEAPCWAPGVRMEDIPPDDCGAFCDAVGSQILTVVSIHKPGKYPTRVFYTRKWKDPNGREFGKGALRMLSMAPFRRLIGGYRQPYEVVK